MASLTLLRRAAGALALGLIHAAAPAQPSDIDIYSGVGTSGDRPNVLFLLDSSANWSANVTNSCTYKDGGVSTGVGPLPQSAKYAIEMCALYNVVDALPVSGSGDLDRDALFNVGLMLMNESPRDGGYPRRALLPLTTNNKAAFKTLIKSLGALSDKGSNADFGQALYEAYLYLSSRAPLNGKMGTKWDANAFNGNKYAPPRASACVSNHVIVIGNGSPQNSNPEKQVQSLLSAAVDADFASSTAAVRDALKAKIVNPALGNDEANWSDEMARFMRQTKIGGLEDSPGITTHAIAVTKGPSDGNFPALMNSIANYGGGSYYEARTADTLVQVILKIFNQVQAVDSVFASASLPVSVNARGTYANQIYIGSFRPDADGKPRWRGNLKQYRFALDATDQLFLADANGSVALSGTTGFFLPSAKSYWTSDSSFWTATPLGTPPSTSDAPDGEIVEKGGGAQRLRTTFAASQATRKVYTCLDCAGGTVLGSSDATLFSTANANLTQALLGVGSATERSDLIGWVRGLNNAGDTPGPTTDPVTTVRADVHGDVLHSRPAVVNYGGATGVRVFYGANDGQLRAVNGNPSGAGAGEELWSFVPQEQLGKLGRLRANAPLIKLSTTPDGIGAVARDYFVDGPIGMYQKLGDGGAVERVILYVGMRRGGRQVYALDVTSPESPKFLWKVTPATAGMGRLGQTWSEPRVARVKGHDNPVVIFGGGYDAAAEDSGAAVTMGNAVYVLDALTGSLLRTFTTLDAGVGSIGRPVPADVSLVDSDFDGKVDRAYAVDLGGQIYRIDFENEAGHGPDDWTVYKFADLSGGTLTGRKFFYRPDVVLTRDFAALIVGSGDREKPLLTATQDHFFQVFDRRTEKGAPLLAVPVTFAGLTAMGATPSVDGHGCYMALDQGEKAVNAATSLAGYSFFGTNKPSAAAAGSTCSANLGIAKSYEMPLFCVASAGSVLVGGGLPPSPVSGIVTVTRPDGTTAQVPFVIGAPNERRSAIEGSRVTPVIDSPRRRRYWFQEVQR
jgi:type IV pilus assembly protein PilY1